VLHPSSARAGASRATDRWGFGRRLAVVVLAALAAPVATALRAEYPAEWNDWNRPVEPFRIVEGLYYVGASDLTSFLITTDAGHVLLDGGLPETAAQNSHAHLDHAGGLAELAKATGATVVASDEDAIQLERGGTGDFGFGDSLPFPPVAVGRRIADGETVTLGGVILTAHLTPGHTKGCTTWTAKLGGQDAVFFCSASVPGYRLVDNPAWPGIVAAYESTFRKLERLPCSLFLAPHGGFFDLEGKRARAAAGGGPVSPFVDPAGCRRYLEEAEKAFRAELDRQSAGSAKAAPAP
jgi:metallo-beta-lactamase class B